MTNDPDVYARVISPAANSAVSLARQIRDWTGRSSQYVEGGGLGFGYEFDSDGGVRIVVDWQGTRRLQVVQPADDNDPRVVLPFDDGEDWADVLGDTVRDLRQVVNAIDAKPIGKPH